jgi:hypothetical protein
MAFGFGKGEKRSGQGWGRRRGRGGPPINCICPACGQVLPHEPGVPCFKRRCPNCGAFMTRQFSQEER